MVSERGRYAGRLGDRRQESIARRTENRALARGRDDRRRTSRRVARDAGDASVAIRDRDEPPGGVVRECVPYRLRQRVERAQVASRAAELVDLAPVRGADEDVRLGERRERALNAPNPTIGILWHVERAIRSEGDE